MHRADVHPLDPTPGPPLKKDVPLRLECDWYGRVYFDVDPKTNEIWLDDLEDEK